jgi:hypothetical protein
VSPSSRTPAGIAYDRAGPRGACLSSFSMPVSADRRMWDPTRTPDLRALIEAENGALARRDLGDAVEANLTW